MPRPRILLAVALVLILLGGISAEVLQANGVGRTKIVGYFDNTNGIYVGDNVVVLGVPVGRIESIEPQPDRVKVTFWYDNKYKVPADARAVILSPSLVTVRALQLTPAYTGGPEMRTNTVIPQERTAVPVEYDDLRRQLEKLTETLQPTQPGGVSTLGAAIDTAAANLRGEGPDIRDSILKLSQAVSALNDHHDDLFSTLKNLATLVSALHGSSDVLRQLNQNLAAVTDQLSNDPNEVGNAVRNLNDVIGDVTSFVADNREALGTTSDKLGSVSKALNESIPDIEQLLHFAPTAFQNFVNIYQPAQATLTGALALNNFADTTQFICSAVQAASRLGAEQSAKLCVQYLAPIIKNRQYNFLPLGLNPFVGATARPNEITYSEDWLRPDYIPPSPSQSPPSSNEQDAVAPPPNGPLPTPNSIYRYFGHGRVDPNHANAPFVPSKPENPLPTDPKTGLRGMMLPPGGGQ